MAHAGLQRLLDSLVLASTGDDTFSGEGNVDSGGRIYGGLVLAQAVSACYRTVDEALHLHALQSHFLRQGDLAVPVEYRVLRLRDGRSFVTRRVDAIQHDKVIFTATLSFQRRESGPAHHADMPEVVGPDGLASERERMAAYVPGSDYLWPVEYRHIEPMSLLEPSPHRPRSQVWFRAADAMPDEPVLHEAVFAYASDNPILIPAMNPHALTPFMPGAMLATLNHAIWLHRPLRMDDWLFYDIHSDITGAGRGMGRGQVFNRDGELLASVVQEGLLRYRKPDTRAVDNGEL